MEFETYKNVICLPCTGAENGPVMPGVKGGLYQADHTLIPEGFLYRQHTPIVLRGRNLQQTRKEDVPVIPIHHQGTPNGPKHTLNGSYIFAGYLFKHFGHFLLESLATLWFIKKHPQTPLLWISAHGQPELLPYQQDILKLLGIGNGIHILTEESLVEELTVPEPGYMIQTRFAEEQKTAFQVLEAPAPVAGKKVWLSRSSAKMGRFLNEDILEGILQKEGWVIYKPEKHPIQEQVHFLSDAEHIAGIAGSALHLVIFFPNYQGKVSIFPRDNELNYNFLNISDRLKLNQTVYFEHIVDCSPKLPPWIKDWCWADLNQVLQHLGIQNSAQRTTFSTICKIIADTKDKRWKIIRQFIRKKRGARSYNLPQLVQQPCSTNR